MRLKITKGISSGHTFAAEVKEGSLYREAHSIPPNVADELGLTIVECSRAEELMLHTLGYSLGYDNSQQTSRIVFLVSPQERKQLENAAKTADLSLSEFIRQRVLTDSFVSR